ncbi:hypothetical protein CTA2_12162 [Colletotrichum tanaceti]|uniref:Uncharacterized protein n=1 Tax=Colletotrichum tanaceti TaxID=1306861 RepID=A0A4U6XHV7_9PEZI|nr:hypothetical protein CTA2_12162 [Colletotrichum tanaceti]TKW55224.1 hypothetical protein CTA1_9430 [Colletotrichum tanaceti]
MAAIAALYKYFKIVTETNFETITPKQDTAISYKLGFTIAAFTGLAYLIVIIALYRGQCYLFSNYIELMPRNYLILLLLPITLISKLRIRIRKYTPLSIASVLTSAPHQTSNLTYLVF